MSKKRLNARVRSRRHFEDTMVYATRRFLIDEGRRAVEEEKAAAEFTLPPEELVWLRQLMQQQRRRTRIDRLNTGLKTAGKAAAIVLLAVTVGFSAAFVTVSAVRTGVMNVWQEFKEGVTSIVIRPGESGGVQQWAYPGVVPEGFIVTDNERTAVRETSRFERGEDWFRYIRTTFDGAEAGAGVSETNETRESRFINRAPGQLSYNDAGDTVLVWYTETDLYKITASLTWEETIKLAESVPLN